MSDLISNDNDRPVGIGVKPERKVNIAPEMPAFFVATFLRSLARDKMHKAQGRGDGEYAAF